MPPPAPQQNVDGGSARLHYLAPRPLTARGSCTPLGTAQVARVVETSAAVGLLGQPRAQPRQQSL